MNDISLQALLEAGCHFGHKSERWHPKAAEFIYTEKDGIHIIDLAKTKESLESAMTFLRELVAGGGEVLFVGTKRQAKGVVKEEADIAGAPYLVERWIGGFLTNWDAIHANIVKINRMLEEQANGTWKKFPKHEQAKLGRYLKRLQVFYGGVLTIKEVPQAVFVVDVRKEIAAVREAQRRGIPVIAIVDTNSDPTNIDYAIPANDDAVGSIKFIVSSLSRAYQEGKSLKVKQAEQETKAAQKESEKADAQKAKADKKPDEKEVKKEHETSDKPKKSTKKKE